MGKKQTDPQRAALEYIEQVGLASAYDGSGISTATAKSLARAGSVEFEWRDPVWRHGKWCPTWVIRPKADRAQERAA